jgi:Domain of unknown function (DUF4360)
MSPLQYIAFLLLALEATASNSLHHRQTDSISNTPSTDSNTSSSNDQLSGTNNVIIDQISTRGAGCPRTSTSAAVSADMSNVTISGFAKSFHAAIGPAASQADRQKNCVVQMHVSRVVVGPTQADGGSSTVDGAAVVDEGTASDGQSTPARMVPANNAQFTIRQSSMDGFARLDAGVLGRLYSSFYFSRNPDNMVRCPSLYPSIQYP